jgi:carbon monoxide dehydrogenase subunit G
VGPLALDDLAGYDELVGGFLPNCARAIAMTVRVERELELPVDVERVWAFIANPSERAAAIEVVEDFEVHDDGRATWHVSLPIPVVSRTVTVKTTERAREPPTFVKFEGRSRVFQVVGEHELEAIDGGTRLTSRFVVDGRLPGVERFFESRLDDELDNLEAALLANLGLEAGDGP